MPSSKILIASLAVISLGLAACRPAPAAAPAPAASPTPALKFAGPVSVTSARMLTAVVDDKEPLFAALSPDGAHIAFYKDVGSGADRKGQICIFTFSSAAKSCHDLTRDKFAGYPYQLAWSPDSAMIAFTENPAELGNESDIWLFKVSDGSFTNLTDDGITLGWRDAMRAQPDRPITLDYLPAWSAADGKIYFWRGVPKGDMKFDLAVYRIDPAGGEPEQVRDVGADLPQHLPIFKQERFFLDGPSAVSPDGKSVAALMSSIDEFGGLQTGLYLIDLADTSIAPRELITPGGYGAALPAWQEFPPYPEGVSWTADGKGIVVMTESFDTHTPMQVYYHVDAASGAVTPVVNFSGLESPEAYNAIAPDSQLPWRYYSPRTGSISPNGDKLLMMSDVAGVVGLLTSVLPPGGALPFVSGATEATAASVASRSSRSKDGKVLMYGVLLNVEEGAAQ